MEPARLGKNSAKKSRFLRYFANDHKFACQTKGRAQIDLKNPEKCSIFEHESPFYDSLSEAFLSGTKIAPSLKFDSSRRRSPSLPKRRMAAFGLLPKRKGHRGQSVSGQYFTSFGLSPQHLRQFSRIRFMTFISPLTLILLSRFSYCSDIIGILADCRRQRRDL